MSRRRSVRSLSVPIILASIGVPLSIALLVGWTFLTVKTTDLAGNLWLLVLGALAFVVIMAVLVMFSVFLVREVLEVRRQHSFIDSVTHELKSPLASLKLCLETLERPEVEDEQREMLHEMMLNDVDRLASFIDDVLHASRLTHDRVGINLSRFCLRELVQRCVQASSVRARLLPGAIRVDVDPEFRVTSDRAALEIVVRNLLDNAIKYSGAEVDVRVSARATEGEGIVLEVRDQGIGIHPKQQKRIFQRFYRVESENVRARRGTGLGLFVVSALVRNLGGTVEARSQGEGHGSTFVVTLPPTCGHTADGFASRRLPAQDSV